MEAGPIPYEMLFANWRSGDGRAPDSNRKSTWKVSECETLMRAARSVWPLLGEQQRTVAHLTREITTRTEVQSLNRTDAAIEAHLRTHRKGIPTVCPNHQHLEDPSYNRFPTYSPGWNLAMSAEPSDPTPSSVPSGPSSVQVSPSLPALPQPSPAVPMMALSMPQSMATPSVTVPPVQQRIDNIPIHPDNQRLQLFRTLIHNRRLEWEVRMYDDLIRFSQYLVASLTGTPSAPVPTPQPARHNAAADPTAHTTHQT